MKPPEPFDQATVAQMLAGLRNQLEQAENERNMAQVEVVTLKAQLAEANRRADGCEGAFNLIANCADTLRARDFGGDLGPIDIRVMTMAKELDAARAEVRALQEWKLTAADELCRWGVELKEAAATSESLQAQVVAWREMCTDDKGERRMWHVSLDLADEIIGKTEAYAGKTTIDRTELVHLRHLVQQAVCYWDTLCRFSENPGILLDDDPSELLAAMRELAMKARATLGVPASTSHE